MFKPIYEATVNINLEDIEDEIKDFISTTCDPEGVFSVDVLSAWATDNGFVEEE